MSKLSARSTGLALRVFWRRSGESSERTTLEKLTGWTIRLKEAADDCMGHAIEMIGRDEEAALRFQRQVGENLIQAYALPTNVVRYNTTSFNVCSSHLFPWPLTKATVELSHIKARLDDIRESYQTRAERIIKQRQVEGLLTVVAVESTNT